ncbi:hypothetical protein Taro_026259 [Colocasia esculenta]|uniref:Uncharacterized protein n=1 Tax=Colocasia esculenta TaxID=4460 RepID=A0A843V5R8_COLES|nr:hypothetical protein [Colocasia esculenta]
MRKQTRRHTLVETKELTEHRSNRMRPESHNTSTNILDLHEVGKEQPGVTPRDTKQPSEKEHLTTGTATSELHEVEGPQTESPYTSDTPRVPPRTAPRNGLQKLQLGACKRHPKRTRRAETTKHGPRGQTNQAHRTRHG